MSGNKETSIRRTGLSLPDILAFGFLIAIFACFIYVANHWAAPLTTLEPVDLSLKSLPKATFLSLTRILISYFVCLISSLFVGYWAAHSKVAETLLIPMIDIGQSVPVLGFLPGFVLTFLALFPESRVGLEMAAVLTLYTGMAWNLMLSFYGSIKSVPREYLDIIKAYGYNRVGVLLRLELPWAMNGLIWNSMLSVAGGWFFLTVCESYQLGDKSFRLIGLGSYMALAAERGDVFAMISGIGVMVSILVITDYFIWNPLLRWAERFQFSPSMDAEEEETGYNVITFFAKSKRIVSFVRRLRKRYAVYFFTSTKAARRRRRRQNLRTWKLPPWLSVDYFLIVFVVSVTLWGFSVSATLISQLSLAEWQILLRDAAWSLLRVSCVLLLSCVTMIPLGLWLGSQSHLVRRLQPVIQVVAAFPAPMIFPLLMSVFLFFSIPISWGSILLMMTGAQWYLLFNVISGAATVPSSLEEVARLSGLSRAQILFKVYLPAAFPQILTGLITAAGGAWNTSIVAELVVFRGQSYEAHGLGSYIARATNNAQYGALIAAVILMVAIIVLINRFFWAKLYNLADDKYRLS